MLFAVRWRAVFPLEAVRFKLEAVAGVQDQHRSNGGPRADQLLMTRVAADEQRGGEGVGFSRRREDDRGENGAG